MSSKATKLEYTIDNDKYKGRHAKKGRHETKQRVLITNMEPAKDCTGKKLGTCQLNCNTKCYAEQAEIQYPDCYPYRKRQEKQWLEKDATWFKMQIIGIQQRARKKITHHRLNESGEMKDVNCWEKAEDIAKCNKTVGIDTFIYTSREDIWDQVKHRPERAMVVNGSGFMADNEYKVVPEDYKLKPGEVWCRDNCHICKMCKKRLGLTICSKARHTKKSK